MPVLIPKLLSQLRKEPHDFRLIVLAPSGNQFVDHRVIHIGENALYLHTGRRERKQFRPCVAGRMAHLDVPAGDRYRPVRLVTARAILLAAMTRFYDDPPRALSLIRDVGHSARYRVEQWFSGLPPHSQDYLSGSSGTDGGAVSKDCSTSWNNADHFSRVKRSAM